MVSTLKPLKIGKHTIKFPIGKKRFMKLNIN